jgi:hypothetical protein
VLFVFSVLSLFLPSPLDNKARAVTIPRDVVPAVLVESK